MAVRKPIRKPLPGAVVSPPTTVGRAIQAPLSANPWSSEVARLDRATRESPTFTAAKGRGAVINPQGRFESLRREPCLDALHDELVAAGELSRVCDAASQPSNNDIGPPAVRVELLPPQQATKTEISPISLRRAISRNQSPDIAFDRSLNPYRGCEHGCVYCYARPLASFYGMSPGLDFETKIGARTEMPGLLTKEINARSYVCAPINIGAATDPYQPAERTFKITRQLIEVLLAHGHPFTIVTKGALIARDVDLLEQAARRNLVACFISVSTLDAEFARIWDPRASAPWKRFAAMRALANAGVPVGVLMAPICPFLNDHEIEAVLEQAGRHGAQSAHYTLLRLPHEIAPMFDSWLKLHFPARAARVLARLRDLRTGRLNDARFHARMHGQGVWGALLSKRFRIAARRHGLSRERRELDHQHFAPSKRSHDTSLRRSGSDSAAAVRQASLF